MTSGIILGVLKATMGLRVSKEEELEGLDIHEHGMDAYSDFRMNQH
jgi:Amt family ammonium transporter